MRLLTIALLSLIASSSFANLSKACYSATNPQVIRASSEDDKEIWTAKSAHLILETVKDEYAPSGEHTAGRMIVRTQGGPKIEIYAFNDPQLRTALPTYSVECDGGRMTVMKKKSGLVIANSDRIRGEFQAAEGEGCNNANLSFRNLSLKEVSCK